jgi:two-component system alkaline phosphatase synthesis response regulator PhoP
MTHRILIADDEPNILISLEYLMKREGHEVSVARDGQEALDGCCARGPTWCCWT